MRTQSDVREHLCKLIDQPELDPIGFKCEALMEFADSNTITFIRNFKIAKPKKGKRMQQVGKRVYNWRPVPLAEDAINTHIKISLKALWEELKKDNSDAKMISFHRFLDKLEAAFWILEDQEAIDFIRSPEKYEKSAVLLTTWLSDRYDFVPK